MTTKYLKSFVFVVFCLCTFAGLVSAQSHSVRIDERSLDGKELNDKSERADKQATRNVVVELSLEASERKFGGLQFEIEYADNIEVVDVDSCLEGVPETHKGAFTACSVLPEKRVIRVVATDIGKLREIPAGLLGIVGLNVAGELQDDSLRIRGLQALTTSGESILRPDKVDVITVREIR